MDLAYMLTVLRIMRPVETMVSFQPYAMVCCSQRKSGREKGDYHKTVLLI